jgi:uncharacterized damage-inducible protein DinB
MERIVDLLDRAGSGNAWHGPSIAEILKDVATGEAAAKPIESAHSIWEIVLHIAVWERVVTTRLGGGELEPTAEEDWPAVGMTGDGAWRQAIAALTESRAGLRAALLSFDEARLDDAVRGKGYSFYVMAHGIVQHDLYHAGQLALLKRAARSTAA